MEELAGYVLLFYQRGENSEDYREELLLCERKVTKTTRGLKADERLREQEKSEKDDEFFTEESYA